MNTVISTHSLKIEGDDAIKFIESLISIDPMDNIFKTSFLLKPDGKVNHWFVIKRVNDKLFLYQSEQELTRIKESLDFYKIRTKCSLEIIKDEKYLITNLYKSNNFMQEFIDKRLKKFRGRPRRLLQSNKDFQEFIKI